MQGDGGVGDRLRFDLDAFLGFHRLMETIAPAPPGHEPPRGLVHDDNFACLYQIILVAVEEVLRAHCLLKVAHQTRLFGVEVFGAVGVEQLDAQQGFDAAHTDLGQVDRAGFFVDLIVFGLELFDDLRHAPVPFQVA